MGDNETENKSVPNLHPNVNVQCCFCGPVRQCGPYLQDVMQNIKKIGSHLFGTKYAVVIFYDKSNDNSLAVLKKWKEKWLKFGITMHLFINPATTLLPYRTHRIALARNKCVDIIHNKYPQCPYFAMMDFDSPNSKPCRNVEKLDKYFDKDRMLNKWDALSFQTSPQYYDIWALSIPPFSFSYNHFPNNDRYYGIIQKYVNKRLATTTSLVPCISAFNGFSFYKTAKFRGCRYAGSIGASIQCSRQSWINDHKRATRSSSLVFIDYGNVNGKQEDCEHRSFHMQGINRHNARIRISPEIIFG